ncbi:HD domain-containing protein [Halobacillus yeomjeoni]|uniref:HD domain-containing phosphohydrolase n=1 Tax=Halobacillus yeomjeoni TaxID=311194 RepID=UPI001CD335A7|nr:HD domain-containing phosphohydrolase [Halobacillus yeomjeoni]MCA0984072.1 HD domain-containing protein [Halobacillus yeomjeoni]
MKYGIEELSQSIDRSSAIVQEWFHDLEEKLDYHIPIKNGKRLYDDRDLSIAAFIAEKRDERWSLNEIYKRIEEIFPLKKEVPQVEVLNNDSIDSFIGLGPDPESLFYSIAQNNEIISNFKYHSLRVMYMASMLAKRVNCYDEDLRIAALLHDIGKMGLSADILLKPSKLNDLEYTIVQSHSHIGNMIVRKHLGLTRAAKFIRDHHERWDGQGYPRRLIGDEISVQGRIISICDAFDTMTVDQRTYNKKTLSYQEAFEELENFSWKQFDGNLTRIFIDMMKDEKIPEYMMSEQQ